MSEAPAVGEPQPLKWLRRKLDDIAHDHGLAFADTVEIDAALDAIGRALATLPVVPPPDDVHGCLACVICGHPIERSGQAVRRSKLGDRE